MKKLAVRVFQDESGFLTFEWIMLITVLVIGITGGLSAVRDALNWELGGVSGAIVALDLSYKVAGPVIIQWQVDGKPEDGGVFGEGADAIIYVSGIAAGTWYKYTPEPIYYRPRGDDTTIGGGTGILQPGPDDGTPGGKKVKQEITAVGPQPDAGIVTP